MHKKSYFEDIICARATPPGPSSIAIIRVSGKNCWNILKKIFSPFKKNTQYETGRSYYGKIINQNKNIDNVIVLTFSDKNSFTGEESFEINCHGSEVILSIIIKLLVSKEIRIAEPGEFSKRAFLNKKIDLTKAEAIMDLVHASTKKSALIAYQQISGRITTEINIIKNEIANLLSEIEADIDYPEEDITFDTKNRIKRTKALINKLKSLLKSFNIGRYYREGIHAVILGKTNSGKSTLFNFLLNEDKAIVSDIHGTTRDFLDSVININGFGIRIYDTAGLRKSKNPIEKEGTKRAVNLSLKSNLIIYVISITEGLNKDDKENILRFKNEKKILIILNKIDLVTENCETIIAEIKNLFNNNEKKYRIVKMSGLKQKGLKKI